MHLLYRWLRVIRLFLVIPVAERSLERELPAWIELRVRMVASIIWDRPLV